MSEWVWKLTDTARHDLDQLDEEARERVVRKLDEVVTDEWRTPADYLEPLAGTGHEKLRVGQHRLGCRVDTRETVLYVLRIRKRGGDAYRSDDD